MANSGLEEYRKKLKEGTVKKTRDKNRPSATKAIKEKCYDCCSGYQDGKLDCAIETCSLYYFMPYGKRKKERKLQKQLNKTKNTMNETEDKYWT